MIVSTQRSRERAPRSASDLSISPPRSRRLWLFVLSLLIVTAACGNSSANKDQQPPSADAGGVPFDGRSALDRGPADSGALPDGADGDGVTDGAFAPQGDIVSTLAGSDVSGVVDGPGAQARFNNPVNLAVASDGTIYVADYENSLIRQLTPDGVVSTLPIRDSNGAAREDFGWPFGLVFTPDGTFYVQTDANDTGGYEAFTGTIWRVDRQTGGAEVVARDLGTPRGLVALSNGELGLSDLYNHTVSVLDLSTGQTQVVAGQTRQPGMADGQGTSARFDRPYDIVRRGDGSLLVADQNNNRLRLVQLDGTVSTFAGDGQQGYLDGPRLSARFDLPQSLAIDTTGVVYVGEFGGHRIRRIGLDGQVTTIAGSGTPGHLDGPALQAQFWALEGLDLSVDASTLYIADGDRGDSEAPYHRIRRLTLGAPTPR